MTTTLFIPPGIPTCRSNSALPRISDYY